MEEKETNPILRDIIAKIILFATFGIIIYMISNWADATPKKDPEALFNILLPILSTWIGTLLAFYFGKANFEAATKSYNQVIDKLTPDILDDVLVKQVMIDKFTMVSIDTSNPMITTFNLKGLRDFLDSINKSRLPILENGKIKYIVHKSTFSDELLKTQPAIDLSSFVAANPTVVQFITINENKKVEEARKLMNEKNYKDLFVVDANGLVVGWLTDTQIIRYMDNQQL